MGARRKSRELALKILFEADFNKIPLGVIADRMITEQEVEIEVGQFIQKLLDAYRDHEAEVNILIEKHSSNWKLSRMAGVDRNILRLGVSEILYFDDIPKNVTINECLEIAKKYGTEDSSSFINGILDKIEKGTVEK